MKKVLLVSVCSGFVPCFEMNNVRILQEMGYEVHYAANQNLTNPFPDGSKLQGTGVICRHIDFARSPYSPKNLKAYRQFRDLVTYEDFELVHCHTPMGSIVARLACRNLRKKGLKVIYTAHGFHFYKGGPLLNWLLYYPMEKLFANWTDVLITIDREDYDLALRKFHPRKVKYVGGVGINLTKFAKREDTGALRKELGLPDDAILLMSVGELSKRKNHQLAIRALARLYANGFDKDVYYLIVGEGGSREELLALTAKLRLSERVRLLGTRLDVPELLSQVDAFVFPSLQEGLPVALMEALAAKVPTIASNIRGNNELVDPQFLFRSKDVADAERKLRLALTEEYDCVEDNYERLRVFGLDNVERKMRNIYRAALNPQELSEGK